MRLQNFFLLHILNISRKNSTVLHQMTALHKSTPKQRAALQANMSVSSWTTKDDLAHLSSRSSREYDARIKW